MDYRTIVEGFKGIPTGNICDSYNRNGSMDAGIQGLDRHFTMVGKAMPVVCHPGDNLTLHKAIHEAEPGVVLVVSCNGYTGAGCFGEMFAISCVKKAIAGLVVDGAVRDRNGIIELGFPVFARGTNPGGTTKEVLGSINGTIVCGGQIVCPGDIIVGDCDGVVVIPKDKAAGILEKSKKKFELEETVFRPQLEEGKTTVDIIGLDKKWAK